MNNTFYFCLLLLTCNALMTNAQGDITLSGQVRDENNAAVPFANAALYSNDSTLLTGAVTDESGNFSIAAPPGKYYLKITFLSYEEKTISPINLSSNVNLGTIILKPSTQLLEAITVEGEKSQMDLYLDKRVFQVGKDLSNISGSASDILDNVPSVAVDVEGNISLRGSQNVRILIDGKPSGLAGISTADALRQLQGNLIESVEVITNPSARYDAEGEVGIINIILKKEKKKGVNGSFTLNTGYPDNHGASFSLNFRREKVNFFTSYGFAYRSTPGSGSSYQSFTLNDATQALDTSFSYYQLNERTRSDISHNLRAGMDYYLNDKSMLTGSFILRRSDGSNTSRNVYTDFDENNTMVNTVIRDEDEDEPEWNSEIALSFRREFDKKGQLLTVDAKWIENQETEYATFTESNLASDDVINQRSDNTEDERNALLQADYIHPYGAKGKIEAGLKSTLRVINNEFAVGQFDNETSNWFTIDDLNNHLVYTENIHAAYFIIGNEMDRFSWQTGLRGEVSDITTELKKENQTNYQNYFNLFPSAHLSYRITPEKTVQLSYSYRLSRPSFRDLMPFSNYSDNRSVPIGNPALRPEYTNSIEAGYLLNWKSGSLLSSLYYRYRTGVIQTVAVVNEEGFTNSTPVNLGSQDAYGLELNLSFSPVNWWRLNTNANLYREITEGEYNEQDLSADTYTATSRTTSKFTLFKTWDVQAGLNYRAPRKTTQGEERSLYFVDTGLSRDLIKGNATLTFAVRDVFNSRRFRSIIDRPEEGLYSEREFQWRARQFLLTFTYRLNSKKETRSREGSSEGDLGSGDF